LLKGFLIAAGVILGLAVAALVGINLYVQSAGTQKRIESALSSGLKVPVHVTSTIVTPWSGLKASGITVPQVAPATGNFLEAASFTAHFDWLALAKHRLDASELSLNEPRVTWVQSAGGRWELPRAMAQASAAPAVATPGRPSGPPWEIHVGKLLVNGASFDFLDERGMLMLGFAGVKFDCINPRATGTQGHASAKNVSLHDKLFFREMQTNWSFGSGLLKLTAFQTAVAGGEIRGDAQVVTQAKRSPFNVDVNFDGVNVDQMMIEAGQPTGEVTGTLKGWLDLNGNTGKTSSINGSGHLELAHGRMHYELFEMLGQALHIPDLLDLDLKTAQADARVVSGIVNVDRLVLESQNMQFSAHGTIGDKGALKLKARMTIDDAISRRLPSFVLTYFKPGDTADTRYIDYEINNTLAHPMNDLVQSILGRRIQGQMTDLLQSVFGKKHKAAASPP
jgi:type II secretion system protein N